jgi:PhnB protein
MDRRTLVRRYFDSFVTGDRTAIEGLLSPGFTFTSPDSPQLDRAAYFERRWPHAATLERHELALVLTDGDDAVVHYDGHMRTGETVHNVERFHFVGDLIQSIELFVGRALTPAAPATVDAEAAIRVVLEQRKEALQAHDARLVMAKHAPDAVTFGLAPPLVAAGDAEAELVAWLKSFRGPLHWQTRDPHITASGDCAFVTALEHMRGTKTDGHDVDLWFRTTLGLRRIDGAWKIVHEHQSVPFYMDTLRAAVDLKPPHRAPHGGSARAADAHRDGAGGAASLH